MRASCRARLSSVAESESFTSSLSIKLFLSYICQSKHRHKHETNVFNLRLQNQPATDPSSNLQTDCSSSSSSSSGNRRLTQSPESCPPCVHTHALKTNKNYSVDNQGLIQIFVLPSINKSVNLLHRS